MPRETQTLLHSDATISAVSSVGSATASSKAQSPHSAAASGGEPNQAAAQTARAEASAASISASARASAAALPVKTAPGLSGRTSIFSRAALACSELYIRQAAHSRARTFSMLISCQFADSRMSSSAPSCAR